MCDAKPLAQLRKQCEKVVRMKTKHRKAGEEDDILLEVWRSCLSVLIRFFRFLIRFLRFQASDFSYFKGKFPLFQLFSKS